MKRVATVAIAAVLAATTAGALAGCGNSESTIRIFLLANDAEDRFYNQYFDELEATLQEEGLNYTIEYNGEQESNYYDKLDTDFNTGDLPDIFYIRPNELYTYHEYIAPLQDYADGDGKAYANLDNIYEEALDMYRYNEATGEIGGKNDPLYAFPKDLSTQQLGYNVRLLEAYESEITKLGFKIPQKMDFTKENYTWEQFRQISEVISKGKKSYKNFKDELVTVLCGCDVPSIEILVKSFGGELIDLSNGRKKATICDLTSEPIKKAIEYQESLITGGAVVYDKGEGFNHFTKGEIGFYSLVGSWEISQYNDYLGEDGWDIMPWPTESGKPEGWQGAITSAGYVVSKDCADSAKGDVAKRIAISFMSDAVQERMVKTDKVTLPLRKSAAQEYLKAENNNIFFPKHRQFFLDVISGEHGFFPATYKTYDSTWLDTLSTQLELIWTKKAKASTTNWADLRNKMQQQYDLTKNNG